MEARVELNGVRFSTFVATVLASVDEQKLAKFVVEHPEESEMDLSKEEDNKMS